MIIPFSDPPLGQDLSVEELEVFSSLPDIFERASHSVGFIIQLGHEIKERGFDEIRREMYPFVKNALGGVCHPRVIVGYAIMLWFTYKVCNFYTIITILADLLTFF